MIPASFDYLRADSVDHALSLLAGGHSLLLAGGHSLLPMMKLRLAAPELVVDIGGLASLRYVVRDGEMVSIGAATPYADLLSSDVIRQSVPLLGQASATVGDPQVRYRGTVGGALAHADPTADLPAAVLALDGIVQARSTAGTREIPAAEFFVDYFETALAPGEMVTGVRIPATGAEAFHYEKFTTRSGGWATVAVAVAGTRIALAGMGPRPMRATAAEDVLASGGDFAAAAELAASDTAPVDDDAADADYRRHLARVLTFRALRAAHRR